MLPKKLAIVGCGSLGSCMAYMIMLNSLDNKITDLTLIDNDILESKNIPYLSVCDKYSHLMMKPKVWVLESIIEDINTKVHIKTIHDNMENITISPDVYMIDCRDTPSECSRTSLKINIDGQFGLINRNPHDRLENNHARYSIKNSKYYSHLMASYCVQVVAGDILLSAHEADKFLVDLKGGKIRPLSVRSLI